MAKRRYRHPASRKAALKSYRRRVKHSSCRRLTRKHCGKRSGCKYVTGRRRSFCRRGSNVSRRR